MQKLVEEFPNQLKEAISIGEKADFSSIDADEIRNVALLGLGGSAFGGELIRNLTADNMRVPFSIHRGYNAPAYAGKHTLAIISSYSGNTEETLSMAGQMLEKGVQAVAVTSNGKLAGIAKERGFPHITLPGGYPPRAAAGFSFVQQLFILRELKLIHDFRKELEDAIALLEAFDAHAQAESVAARLANKLPVIYAGDAADAVAIRLRQQINENSKQLCWHHTVPEMNHNELVGWEHPQWLHQQVQPVFLQTDYDHPRVALRFGINKEILQQYASEVLTLRAEGSSHLAQLLYLLHFADWVSLYLAKANATDPTPVKVIDFLKAELGKHA